MLGRRPITLVRRQSTSRCERGSLQSVTAGFTPAALCVSVRLLGYAFPQLLRGFFVT